MADRQGENSLNLFVFGLGYSALHFVRQHRNGFVRIGGSVRTIEKRDALRAEGIDAFVFDDEAITSFLHDCDDVVVSIGPGDNGDPALRDYRTQLQDMPLLQRIVYLSTVGVYGDHGGARVDESSELRPLSLRSRQRLQAEEAWREFSREKGCDLHILRLAGIYGPGRSAIDNLRNGKAKRIVKPGQVFNRVHVEDIARTIDACLKRPPGDGCRIWNVTDDEPAPPQDVVAHAAQLLDIPPPPETPFDEADMTPMARSFYGENKRVANRALREDLGVALLYPTYREGLRSLLPQGTIVQSK